MTNLQRQKKLDEQKWLMSEAKGCDQSGKMDWCTYCEWEEKSECLETQLDREMNCLCAKAWNRMVRERAKK